jgi:hypothetical protein
MTQKREKDQINFEFDPYDIDVNRTSHYSELLFTSHSYQWVDSSGKVIDLRKAPLPRISNILNWMVIHDKKETPYMNTKQFRYLQRRYIVLLSRKETAKFLLRFYSHTCANKS